MSNVETASRPTTAMDSAELLIDVCELHKQFKRGKEALRGVDLQVPRGTVLGLLGKNGAGKTTLIKCMIGLLKPTGGSATILGENAWDLSAEAKERLGYVPQVVTLYSWMKVKHQMAYTAAFYRNWNADLAAELVHRWEIPMDDRVGALSVGQQQRLSIVLSLAYEPELLILDEPAASLDPVARREFLGEVLNIVDQQNRSVVFSTHITSDIERVADTVAILKEGSNRLSRRAWRAERFRQAAALFGGGPSARQFRCARRAFDAHRRQPRDGGNARLVAGSDRGVVQPVAGRRAD